MISHYFNEAVDHRERSLSLVAGEYMLRSWRRLQQRILAGPWPATPRRWPKPSKTGQPSLAILFLVSRLSWGSLMFNNHKPTRHDSFQFHASARAKQEQTNTQTSTRTQHSQTVLHYTYIHIYIHTHTLSLERLSLVDAPPAYRHTHHPLVYLLTGQKTDKTDTTALW